MFSGAAVWQGGLRILGSGILAALVTGIGWWVVNPMFFINGVGLLQRQGWPWNSVLLCMAGGAVVGAAGGCWSLYRGNQRARRVREMSWSLGPAFTYTPEVTKDNVPAMPLFKRWYAGRHRVAGKRDGVAVEMFDFTPITDESADDAAKTVVVLAAAGLPPFDLRLRTAGIRFLGMLGVEGISFDPTGVEDPGDAATVERFNESFYLTPVNATPNPFPPPEQAAAASAEERAIRGVFSVAVMEVLTQNPGWSVQSHGGHLAVWPRGGLRPPDSWPELMAVALAIREALQNSRTAAADEPAIPSRPPRPARVSAGRMQSVILGGLVGGFVGFFVGAAGSSAVFFQRPVGPGLGGGFFLVLLIFFGGVFLGTALGALVGSRFPLRVRPAGSEASSEDPQQKAWRHKITGMGAGIGVIAGFFGGIFAAFGVDEVLGVGQRAFWVTSTLTFLGMGLGIVTGGVLGGGIANNLARRWQRDWPEGNAHGPAALPASPPAAPTVPRATAPRKAEAAPQVKGFFAGFLGTLCTMVGIVFLTFACAMGVQSVRLTNGAARTEGTVIRMEQSLGQEGSAPVVRYRVEGKEHEFKSNMQTSPPAYAVGEKVTILYQPDQPDLAGIDSFFDRWALPLIFGGVGAVLTGVSVGAFIVAFRRQRRQLRRVIETEGRAAPEASG